MSGYPIVNPNLFFPPGPATAPSLPSAFPIASPGRWIYDFNPATRQARASFPGEVTLEHPDVPPFSRDTAGLVPAPGETPGNDWTLTAAGTWEPPPAATYLPLAGGTLTGPLHLDQLYPATGGGLKISPPRTSPPWGNYTLTVENPGGTGSALFTNLVTVQGGNLRVSSATTGQVLFEARTDAQVYLRDLPSTANSAANKQYVDNTVAASRIGITNGQGAAAGEIGEVISVSFNGTVNRQAVMNMYTLPLTAGDWEICGSIDVTPDGGATDLLQVLAQTTITSPIYRSLVNFSMQAGNFMSFTQAFVPLRWLSSSSGNFTVQVYVNTTTTQTATVTSEFYARRMR